MYTLGLYLKVLEDRDFVMVFLRFRAKLSINQRVGVQDILIRVNYIVLYNNGRISLYLEILIFSGF